MRVTRRDVLAGMGATAAVAAVGRSAWGQKVSSDFVGGRVLPFAMTEVRLLPGEVRAQAEINERYLDSLAVDRLMYSFRATAGLASPGTPYGGWEKPDCELRGHFNGGHYLSAVALNYASAGNDDLRKRGDVVVAELARCQKANGNGYLSAYPAALFQNLVEGKKVWAPFYTLHKIMAGLVDMYVHTGNEQALDVAEQMAVWVDRYWVGIADDQRQRMLRTEYGGMNEVLANLYGITKKQQYLRTARLFEQPIFLDPLAAHRDELKGLHVNTHVPKVIGAARMYELTGDRRYRGIAEYFLEDVLTERCYAIANTSQNEGWTTVAGDLKGTLNGTNAECCVAYNLMKLERHAFAWNGDARWMDAYERQLWNCRMGTQDAQGRKMYYFPMATGYWKFVGSTEETFWCCTGSGAEEFAKFNDTIYSHDAESVWVNQFVASELNWTEQKFGITQRTTFPMEQGTTLTIKTAAPQIRTVRVRIPGWCTEGGSVKVNGQTLEAFGQPGSYLAITRMWRDGDKVEVSLPMTKWAEPLLGDETLAAQMMGPLVMASVLGDGPKDGPEKIGGYGTRAQNLPKPDPAPAVGSVASKPLYQIVDERYGVYWKA